MTTGTLHLTKSPAIKVKELIKQQEDDPELWCEAIGVEAMKLTIGRLRLALLDLHQVVQYK